MAQEVPYPNILKSEEPCTIYLVMKSSVHDITYLVSHTKIIHFPRKMESRPVLPGMQIIPKQVMKSGTAQTVECGTIRINLVWVTLAYTSK